MGRQHVSPTGAGSKVALEVMPIDSVTPGDGRGPGERTRTRLAGLSFAWLAGGLGAELCVRCWLFGERLDAVERVASLTL